MDKTDLAVESFTKEELIDLCNEVGIGKVQENFESHVLVDLIRQSNQTSNSELFNRFQEIFADKILELDEFEIPDCYEFPHDLDSNCEHCFLYKNCAQELFEKLPNCFGILYDPTECFDCILKDNCRVDLYNSIDQSAQYEVYLIQNTYMLSNILNALALFRYYHSAWPEIVMMSKQNRYWDLKIRNIKKKVDYQVWKDALYFSTNVQKENREIERTPITFEGERIPVTRN